MNEKHISAYIVVWALPLSWAVQRNTGNTAKAGIWLLIGLWLAWRIWKDWPLTPQRPQTALRIVALATWALCAWVVSGIWQEDYGLLKLMLPVMATAVLVILWGPGKVYQGWRVLLIVAFWVVDPFLNIINKGLAGPKIEVLTAAVASLCLWQVGVDVVRVGAQLTTEVGSVIVKYGCTAVPLWALFFHLLVPAGIVFGLTLSRLFLLGCASIICGFAVSVVRVMVIALVVDDKARFEYWHDGDGGELFTMVGFVLFAVLLVQLIPQTTASPAETAPRPMFPKAHYFLATGAVLSLLALTRMLVSGIPVAHVADRPPPEILGSWTVINIEALPVPSYDATAARPEWVKKLTFKGTLPDKPLSVTVASVPVWLDGDPLIASNLWRLTPQGDTSEDWKTIQITPTSKALNRGAAWLASIHRQGAITSESAHWIEITKTLPSTASSWLEWILGRAPLRQKSGLWIALESPGPIPLAPAEAASILELLRNHYFN